MSNLIQIKTLCKKIITLIKSKHSDLMLACMLAILIEGYVVLASELIAIRLLTSFVGGDTPVIAIIISAVLLPLAFGYYQGGKLYNRLKKKQIVVGIRKILIRNAVIASLFLALGLSYIFLELFFALLTDIHIDSRIIQTAIYAVIFIAPPVFLLAQTTPLISNYFSKQNLSETAGKMLFASTIGSFLGGILTSLLLMHLIGVNNTVIFTITALAFFVFILNKNYHCNSNVIMFFVCIMVFALNNNTFFEKIGIIANNQYSTISINEVRNEAEFHSRTLSINNSLSSKYTDNHKMKFPYIKYMENYYLNKLPKDRLNKILIIGAGGFTLGLDDKVNDYTYVDIDKSLLEISEKLFIKQKLTANKKFIAKPARVFLQQNDEKFDLVMVDVYSNDINMPYELVTREFFSQVKGSLSPNGIAVLNVIAKHNFSDDWSVKIDNTLRSVFPYMNRVSIQAVKAWENINANIIYTYFNGQKYNNTIYTDNKNDFFLDK